MATENTSTTTSKTERAPQSAGTENQTSRKYLDKGYAMNPTALFLLIIAMIVMAFLSPFSLAILCLMAMFAGTAEAQ
jgi:hypothetical protein